MMNGAACALISNRAGDVLIVKPHYQEGWLLPGGVIEAGETPSEACRRECKEELGIDVVIGNLLCFEYRKVKNGHGYTTRFVFDCGVIDLQEDEFELQQTELSACRFVQYKEALELLDPPSVRRLEVIRDGQHVYFESTDTL